MSIDQKVLDRFLTEPNGYYFYIEVREGAPGFADDDWHYEGPFKTKKEAILAKKNFNPDKYWKHLRNIYASVIIKVSGGEEDE